MEDQVPENIDPVIAAYYDHAPEESRLEYGAFKLEELRTRELIERHAPPPPAMLLDIGGAAGAYAFWLAERSYAVHLVDASPRLVQKALERNARAARPLASCRVGDARALAFPEGAASVVLLLGPLYHLTEAADRQKALGEAARVLRSGGVLIAAGISRWASALDGLTRDLFRDPQFARIVERDIREGQHRNRTDRLDYFTTAYFHTPEELRAEVEGAGLSVEGLYGVEGPGWLLPDFDERWARCRAARNHSACGPTPGGRASGSWVQCAFDHRGSQGLAGRRHESGQATAAASAGNAGRRAEF